MSDFLEQKYANVLSKYSLHFCEKLNSTNDTAKELAAAGEGDCAVIIAEEQDRGRGKRENIWISPRGNLYMSVIYRPQTAIKAEDAQDAVADALLKCVSELCPKCIAHFKRPNDILVGDKKIAGFLIESASVGDKNILDWMVVGVGVNIECAPDLKDYKSDKLMNYGASNINEILYCLLSHLDVCYNKGIS